MAADSFPFPGGDRTSERKSGRAKEHAWGEQKNWGEVGKEWGEKESPAFNPKHITDERGAIVQFDWLFARQSKYDIKKLSLMHNPTSGTQQDQIR